MLIVASRQSSAGGTGWLSSEDRFAGLSRTVLEVDCRVLGLRSRTGHSISAREPGQELVYCASDELDMRQYVDRRVSPVFRRGYGVAKQRGPLRRPFSNRT